MELWGSLKDFSLPDIIQLVGFGKKSGTLMVSHDGGGTQIFFHEGNIVHAETGKHEGKEAVYKLFRHSEGEFRFQARTNSPPKKTIFIDSLSLVMEAARIVDESARNLKTSAEADYLDEYPTISPVEAKQEIYLVLEAKFGDSSHRLTQAVHKCGETAEEIRRLAERIEKFVSVYYDQNTADHISYRLRAIVERID